MKFPSSMKSLSLPKSLAGLFHKLLHSRIVLYILVVIAIVNVVSNALLRDYLIPSVFFLVAFITSFFHKNMIVVLGVAIAVSNSLKYSTRVRWMTLSEGLDNPDTEDKNASAASSSSSDTKGDASTSTSTTTTGATDGSSTATTPPTAVQPRASAATAATTASASTTNAKPVTAAPSATKLDPATIKELNKLHDSIAKNITTMEESLKNAERIFDKVKDGFDNLPLNRGTPTVSP
jgi:hypothetical protein